jgi:hypothetical protein
MLKANTVHIEQYLAVKYFNTGIAVITYWKQHITLITLLNVLA